MLSILSNYEFYQTNEIYRYLSDNLSTIRSSNNQILAMTNGKILHLKLLLAKSGKKHEHLILKCN